MKKNTTYTSLTVSSSGEPRYAEKRKAIALSGCLVFFVSCVLLCPSPQRQGRDCVSATSFSVLLCCLVSLVTDRTHPSFEELDVHAWADETDPGHCGKEEVDDGMFVLGHFLCAKLCVPGPSFPSSLQCSGDFRFELN